MIGALDTFVLLNRPNPASSIIDPTTRASIEKAIAERRKDIVLTGLRGSRNTSALRYSEYCETIGNQIVRFAKSPTEPDVVLSRFIQLAKEEDAAHRVLEALVLRVYHEGLPAEVESYDPFARR